MREKNIRALDLNLLPVLQALLRHRNVTRAAADVGMSQPAASRALARLRALFGDPLLVRSPAGLALTPRARALARQLDPTLSAVRGLFRTEEFVPAEASYALRIAATDATATLLGPPLMEHLARWAPRIRVQFEGYGADVERRLQAGELDFAFALASTPLPPGAASAVVAEDRLALVMRRGHPASRGRLTLARYASLTHAVIAISGDGRSDVDAELAAHGLERAVGFTAPQFAAAVAVVARTNLVTTISRAYALHTARALRLELREPPFARAALRYVLVWSRHRDEDPLLAWLRDALVALCGAHLAAAAP
jgi:DNA-binding transcriptional LysR family regulator